MHPQSPLASPCWPSCTTGQAPLMPNTAAQTNPAMALAMLSAMQGAALYSPSLATASLYSALPNLSNLTSLISSSYPFPALIPSTSPSANAVASNAYNSAELFSSCTPAPASIFSPSGLMIPSAVAAATANRQVSILPLSAQPQPRTFVPRDSENAVVSVSSHKRAASNDKDTSANVTSKRSHNANEDSTNSSAATDHADHALAFNAWLHQQQLSLPTSASLPSDTSLMLLQQQQQWIAMATGYGSLAGVMPNSAAIYPNPRALFDTLAFQSVGIPINPYTLNLLHNQTLLTNVAYINDEGQLLESLPICRDFKAGKCHRNAECRYVHLLDENVEVNQGRVTVCRDAAKGRCTRVPCKYYHIPLLANSASRSLALSSALSAANILGNAATATISRAPAPTSPLTNAISRNPPPHPHPHPHPPPPSSSSASL